jgi:hypothetical protein
VVTLNLREPVERRIVKCVEWTLTDQALRLRLDPFSEMVVPKHRLVDYISNSPRDAEHGLQAVQ